MDLVRANTVTLALHLIIIARHLHFYAAFRLKTKPEHRPPMNRDSVIQWAEIFAVIKAIKCRGVFLFKGSRREELEKWIRLAAAFPKNCIAYCGR
jgi:hypothetical protein